jgi:hypothetical protein
MQASLPQGAAHAESQTWTTPKFFGLKINNPQRRTSLRAHLRQRVK